uniref:Uncharacterized protein n=1 Tax=viral metagenome TaxID=1070528 RepID=A0A6M3XX15_9ZZZZ
MAENTIYQSDERRVILLRLMLQSPAYRTLPTVTAYRVLSEFMLKRSVQEMKDGREKRGSYWKVTNDGKIVFTYLEAERLGISAYAFRDAIDALLERGFIRITKTGEGKHRRCTFYGIADGWRTWKPGVTVNKRKKRKAQIGFQAADV